ncbi:hypothetical protein ACFO4N_08195 [Camelliibacillus cellulosilyticus]|uniref:Uncharacterized protein n=1 Tax=Camelliibacillus cellulosilyticus TaxID=2174486 RepID=A0ABV9GKS5_9BACL
MKVGMVVRKRTLDELDQIIKEKALAANRATLRYRPLGGERTNKRRPRDPAESRILDRLARKTLQETMT